MKTTRIGLVLAMVVLGGCGWSPGSDGNEGDSCGGFWDDDCRSPLECRDGECVLPGLNGEACATDPECASGLTCIDRVCTPENSQHEGGACDADRDCLSTLVCNTAAQPPACTKPATVAADGLCDRDGLCRDGLPCSAGKCRPLGTGAAGDPCLREGECGAGLACIAGKCRTEGTGIAGDACLDDAACTTGLNCRFGACTARNSVPEDGRCYSDDDCQAGLVCNTGMLKPACTPTGSVARDGQCDTSDVCAPGLICIETPLNLFGGIGTCVPTNLGVGGKCVKTEQCSAGLQCNVGIDGGTCQALQGPGGKCLLDDDDCQEGLLCAKDRCVAPQNEGASCLRDEECAAGLYCQAAPDGDTRACRAYAQADEPCDAVRCADGLACFWTGAEGSPRTCGALRTADQPCAAAGECAATLACIEAVCKPRPVDGEACSTTIPCADGLVCRSGGTCGAPSPVDGACGAAGDCATGLFCVRGTCQEHLQMGDTCTDTAQCGPDLSCNEGYGDGQSTGQCQPRKPAGGTCAHDRDCLMGWVCSYEFGDGRECR